MSNSKEPLVLYLSAVQQNRYNDVVKILTNVINKTKDKDDLLVCLQSRIEAAYRAGNYNQIVKDFKELQNLGFNFDENKQLILILFEAKYRVESEKKTIEELKETATKLSIDLMLTWANRLEVFILDTLFEKDDNSSSKQSSMKRKK